MRMRTIWWLTGAVLVVASGVVLADGTLAELVQERKKAPTEKAAVEKAADEKAADEKAADEKAAVEKAADEKDADAKDAVSFDKHIAPLLAARCLECHSGGEPKGKLDLSRSAAARKGGESGAAVTPGRLDESAVWERVSADEMPPKQPLSAAEKAALKKWIESGAKWGADPIDRFRYTSDRRAGYDWWSLRPLGKPKLPDAGQATWPHNGIDHFVLARLRQAGLQPAPPASPRDLLRRVYFDLTGLPPTPEQVAAFVADPSDAAYRRVVDQLLESPRYGERWGRHWLDVARYGESDGFERNNPRNNLWPYRDWVIRALNADMPYDQFVRLQLAGDVFAPGRDGSSAVGFLVSGVHNTVVGGSERMKKIARQDELEEIIGAVGQTFLGLTINCSRCHDHKFDPIRQTEYYRMIASIQGVRHGERDVKTPVDAKRLAEVTSRLAAVHDQLQAIDSRARQEIIAARKRGDFKLPDPPRPISRWEFDSDFRDSIGSLHGKSVAGARLEGGALIVDGKGFVETVPLPKDIGAKTLEVWLQLDTLQQAGGGAISIETLNGNVFDAIVFAERNKNRWMAGSNIFARTKPFGGAEDTEAASRPVHIAIVYEADGTIRGYRDGKPYGQPYKSKGLQGFAAGQAHLVFGMRHKPAGSNKMLRARILRAGLYDRALPAAAVAASAGNSLEYVPEAELVKHLAESQRSKRTELQKQRVALEAERNRLSGTNSKVYTVVSSNPGTTKLLIRGDVMQEGDEVTAGGVASVRGPQADFGLDKNTSDAERRRRLAQWVTDPQNPLFLRVIVNRVWHYHFGTGLVDTPNDLGFNGGRPSHPELIDWLADRFRKDGYRLKSLHRLIVTSRTYRQSAALNPDAVKVDAANRLLWRATPRRLEAEAVRDTMLAVAGQLNDQMLGPGFVDVSITPNNGTTYYEPKKVDGPAFFRRTVYRFSPRGGRSALLDTFDCPDPSATAPRRPVTTTPLQALSLLNNTFVLQMSDYMARRVVQDAGPDVTAQVERAWLLTVARSPTDRERKLSAGLVSEHGLAALCRGLFNANEFVILQ